MLKFDKYTKVTLNLLTTQVSKLKNLADVKGTTYSMLVRTAINEYLKKHGNEGE